MDFFQWLDRRVQAADGDGGRRQHWIAVLDCASVRGSEALLTGMRRDLWHIHFCFVPATSTVTHQPPEVAAMDDRRPAKLDLRLAQLGPPLMQWVGRSLAELPGMEDLHRKAWAHVTVDEENMPEVLRSAEEKHKRA